VLFSGRAVGARHIPRRGAALLVANHESFLDPIAIGVAIPRHVSYLARKTLFATPFAGALLRALNAVPIDQEGVGKEGIRNILLKLQSGAAVLVFPEGERTADGAFHELRPGVALLLSRVEVPIIPVGIAGAFEAWPRHRALPVPAPMFLPASDRCVAVAFGPPRDPATLKGMSRAQMLATLHADIEEQIRRAERIQRK
jgi:1-acyl-sn-glycerol-3-phosphate acyltransferase